MLRAVPGIGVNEESLPAFQLLLSLNESAWKKYIEKLNSAYSKNLDIKKLIDVLLDSQIEGLTPVTVEMLFEVGLSVYELAEEMGVSVEDALEKATKALESQTKSSHMSQRLTELVRSDALWALHKIRDVLSDEDFSFRKARVITELRPVFGQSIEENPIAFAITHSMKISYMKDFHRSELFVCLDDAGIDAMLKELIRAQTKAKTLKQTAELTGVYVLQNRGF